MEEAAELTNFLPLSLKTPKDQEYIQFLWDAFETGDHSGHLATAPSLRAPHVNRCYAACSAIAAKRIAHGSRISLHGSLNRLLARRLLGILCLAAEYPIPVRRRQRTDDRHNWDLRLLLSRSWRCRHTVGRHRQGERTISLSGNAVRGQTGGADAALSAR